MKKIISMVLILTLALSSFGSVFAASKKVVFKVDDEYKRRGSYNVEYTLRKKSTYKTLPLEGNETAIDQYVSAVDTLNAAATTAGGFVVELTALWAGETNCKSKWSIWIE